MYTIKGSVNRGCFTWISKRKFDSFAEAQSYGSTLEFLGKLPVGTTFWEVKEVEIS